MHLGVYGLKTWDAFYAAGSVSFSHFDNTTTRTILSGGPTETASGAFASHLLGARLETGWRMALGAATVTPFAAVQISKLWQNGYTENSVVAGGAPGVMGLTFAQHTATSLPTFLGAQIESKLDMAGGRVLTPFLRAAWVHEFKPTRSIDAAPTAVPAAAFTVEGPRAASNSAKINAGAQLALNKSSALFASFDGEFSGVSRTYGGTGGIRATW
jgi:outer membrane autotransporter protein